MRATIYVFLMLAVSCLFCSGCAQTNAGTNNSSSNYLMPAPDGSTKEELVAFLESAANYTKEKGQEEAVRAFNDPKGMFIRKDLYVFAYDFNGTTLAHPYRPDLVGKNNINLTDTNGVPIIKNMMVVAMRGKGFSYYVWPNPAHENKEELKLTYVLKVSDNLWLGAGIYLAGRTPYFSPEAREDLTAFVKDAREFALVNGKQKALNAFNDPQGKFIKGDRYVFAYDFNSNTLALPFAPALIGTNRLDTKDPNGVSIGQDKAALARTGSGLYYYLYPDPAENMAVKLKLSYLTKVDDTWWLGSGIYAS
jgi:signal transduction histidine kinase